MNRDEISGLPFRSLLKAMSMTQTQCSRRFDIPLRTIQHWASGDRDCPPYIKLMMAELTGLTEKTEE